MARAPDALAYSFALRLDFVLHGGKEKGKKDEGREGSGEKDRKMKKREKGGR